MSNQGHDIEDLIGKYLAGETTREESELIQKWLTESESNQKHFNQLKTIFTAPVSMTHLHEFDTNAAWEKFRAKVETSSANIKPVGKTREINWFLKIAAGILLISVVSVFLFQIFKETEVNKVNLTAEAATKSDVLPDGTRLYMNKDSRVAYSFNKNTGQHTVKLKGEAYFRINPEENKNFIVEVDDLHVKDIGTSFNIKAYPESSTIEVVVDEGEVRFYSDNDTGVTVTALMKGVYDRETKKFSTVSVQPNSNAYLTRSFSFGNETLQSVVAKLNSVYNEQIELDPRLNECRLTSQFIDENAETIVQIIAETFSVKATQTSTGWQLIGEGCTP